jgi:cell division septation protein DedD
LDSTLKQRLVGATILVLLIVLIVPELLRGKATPAPAAGTTAPPRMANDPAAAVDGGAPLRSVTVDMRDDAPARAPEAGSAEAPPNAAPASAASSTPIAPAPAPAASPPAAVDPEPVPVEPSATGNLPKPVANGPWVVQLGSFALKVSAERLARELKAAGYPAYVSPVKRGARELFRVRVGPMADRAAASSYYTALRAAGKDVAIVPNR